MSSNSNNPDTDPVVEGHEPKSVSSDNSRTEEENNRTDNDVDEGVDLQGIAYIVLQSGTQWLIRIFSLLTSDKSKLRSVILSSADEQLEDNAKEESKQETEASSSPDGGNDSIAESTEQGGADKTEVDGQSPGKNVSQNGTDGEEETTKGDTGSEATADNKPVVGDDESVKVLYGKLT